MSSVQPILSINKVCKNFPGVRALKDVDFYVNPGEVHALVGENGAGKSTLMKIILGSYSMTSGSMTFKGKPYSPSSPHDALLQGISMIHQEISLIPTFTVSDNVWIGREGKFSNFRGVYNRRRQRQATQKILDQLGLNSISPDAEVSRLSVAEMQMVEIARAVSYDSDIVIMDEPTSALTNDEIDKLYEIITDMKKRGKSVIFISHKLEEVFRICDSVTVFRDGQFISRHATSDITQSQLVSLMVGREMKDIYPKQQVKIGAPVLRVEHFNQPGRFKDVSFEVHSGEILGFAGLVGAGRTEIMQALFGIDPHESGKVFLRGQEVHNTNATAAIRNKFALVTEDRLRRGAIHLLSVQSNATIAYLRTVTRHGFIDKKQERKDAENVVRTLAVKTPSLGTEMTLLSGGNQQKVIFGKWLLTQPEVLILDEPTRGIDVGAKAEIYRLIGDLASQGKAIIMVSSELPELMGISDRICVVKGGQIVAEYQRAEFDQEKIMMSAFGVTQNGGNTK
ncbi:MAG TPA: sugar ABC transporter ATP-binding protein [Candidatus Pullichristensenella stercorigallinarum]|uniref:Sugar ABC transporter ATP-binding protein n=1 Tax=Candidatus Pullichristensenella stercorigallinarum TaxID=2840909 RepID=A0A9D0ZMH5_9FIRM|nr:sugar ABC transporter ATP-binding protein [Candidatus Pullichristensenella stercorigallinarum]